MEEGHEMPPDSRLGVAGCPPVLDFHVHPVEVQQQRDWARVLYHQQAPDVAPRIRDFYDPMVLRRHLLEEGIMEAVVVAEITPIASGIVENQTICEYAARGNQEAGTEWLHPFVCFNPWVHRNAARELDSLRSQWRVSGVKLYPPYAHFYPADATLYPLYDACSGLGLPVMFHTGSSVFRGSRLRFADPLLLDEVAVDFPDLKIVLAHAGRGVWYDKADLMARMHENVYLDITGLPPANLPSYFPRLERLAGKMVFGSDWPTIPAEVKGNIQAVRRIFGEKADLVLWETGKRLLAKA